jgi:hypothetical protein
MRKGTIAALGFGLVVMAACGQPAPTRSPEPVPTATPAPSTWAMLQVSGTAVHCGSFGGCAWFAELLGPDQTWKTEFDVATQDDHFVITGDQGLPPSIPAGPYAIRMWVQLVSDEVLNGVRQMGPVATSCADTFRVSSGQSSVDVHVAFGSDSCETIVDGSSP